MPTKMVGCSSMTLPCKCGLWPERLSGFGTVAVRAAPCSVAGLENPRQTRADPHLVASLASLQRATQRYKAVRRAIQLRQESVRAAAKRYGVSPTTIQKWRTRQTTGDAAMGP